MENWLSDLKNRFGATRLIDIGNFECRQFSFRPPHLYGMRLPYVMKEAIGSEEPKESFVCTFENIILSWGDIYGIGTTPEFPTENLGFIPKDSETIIGDIAIDASHTFEDGFLLTIHHSAHNYYHFLIDYFSQSQRVLPDNLHINPIVLSERETDFHGPLLRMAYGREIPVLRRDTTYFFKRLSIPTTLNKACSVDFLRAISADIFSDRRSRRIYITRRSAVGRSVLNEEELIPLLDEYDFSLVDCAELSILDQIKLFKGAEIVCGAHGAGLSNIAFCSPGTHVIEIFLEERGNLSDLFWRMACAGDCVYHCVKGYRVELAQNLHHTEGDILVNPSTLRRAFEASTGMLSR